MAIHFYKIFSKRLPTQYQLLYAKIDGIDHTGYTIRRDPVLLLKAPKHVTFSIPKFLQKQCMKDRQIFDFKLYVKGIKVTYRLTDSTLTQFKHFKLLGEKKADDSLA
ncbi:hypothetical protein ABD73_15770 [Brevibacillus laterosporus]|nr:hypothetical protein [Brevibacillus laterosporus]